MCSILVHFDLGNVFNISTSRPRECFQYYYNLISGKRSILVHFNIESVFNISTF